MWWSSFRRRAHTTTGRMAQLLRSTEPTGLLRTRLQAMHGLAARADDSVFAKHDLTRFEAKVFSQNGEDGVLVELFNRIGAESHFFVEFGIQTGHEGNCIFLADVLGWSGLFIEADASSHEVLKRKYITRSDITTLRAAVTPDTVDSLFGSADVPAEPDVLSVDIDGNDIWVWRALKRYRPRLVVIEYNSALDSFSTVCQRYDPSSFWNKTAGFGASLGALDLLAKSKGYSLVHTDLAGVNAFFLRDDLVSLAGVTDVPRRTINLRLDGVRHPLGEPTSGWQVLSDADL